jgi:hypothetical protein
MRHARVTENRLRVHALPIEARKKSRRSCAVETTIVEADTDLCGVGQKILASGKTRGNIPLAKPFKMDVLLSIVKGKGVSHESAPPSKLATFTENSDAKRDHACGSGGIGRRAGLRILWPQGRGGSTPPFRTRRASLGEFASRAMSAQLIALCKASQYRLPELERPQI